MKEHISMSPKELSRYEELKKALDKRQTVARAAESLGLGPRQAKRLIKRLKAEGPKGLPLPFLEMKNQNPRSHPLGF